MPEANDMFKFEDDLAVVARLDEDGKRTTNGRGWIDSKGFLGPVQPGTGPRRDPIDESPSGPEIGNPLPDVIAIDRFGNPFNLHEHRAGRPGALVFFRSAVW